MEYKEITAELAKKYKDFYLPELQDDPAFDEYFYYAALDNKTLAGLTVLDPTPAGARLKSIGVSPKYQRQGIGLEMMANLMMIVDEKYEPLSAHSEVYFTAKDIRDPDKWEILDSFLQRCAFTLTEKRPLIKVKAEKISAVPGLSQSLSKVNKDSIVSLAEIDDSTLRHFNNKCANEHLFPIIKKSDYDADSSFFYLEKGSVAGCVLNSPSENGNYDNEWVYLAGNEDNKIVMSALIFMSAQVCSQKKGAEITILPTNDIAEKITEKLMGQQPIIKELRIYSHRINPIGVFYTNESGDVSTDSLI